MTQRETERLAVVESRVEDIRDWQKLFDKKFEGYHQSMIAAINNVDDKVEANTQDIARFKVYTSMIVVAIGTAITWTVNRILGRE